MEFEQIRDAIRPIEADYLADVRTMAEEIIRDYREDRTRDIGDLTHQSVDGSWWVTYTYAAQVVMLVSDNDGAIEDYGTDGLVTDGAINWSLLAYCAMEADVRDTINVLAPNLEDEYDCSLCGQPADDETGDGVDHYDCPQRAMDVVRSAL